MDFNIPIWLVLMGLTIFSLVVAEIEAIIDNESIKAVLKQYNYTKSINHLIRGTIRIVIFSIVSFLIFYSDIRLTVLSIVYQLFVFWIYFEIRLNRLRKLPDFYVGNVAKSDKLVRRYLGTNCGEIMFIFKLVFCAFLPIGIILLS